MPYVTAINIHLRHRMDDAIRDLEMIKAEMRPEEVKIKIQETIDAMIRAGLMIRVVEKMVTGEIEVETFLDEFGGIK